MNPEENPFANLDEETQKQIQELQLIEQNFQQNLMQKQAYRMELNETDHSIEELKKAQGEVFKIVGSQIIIKSTIPELQKDLTHKKELLDARLKTLEKQEEEFSEKSNQLRDSIMKKISENK